MKIWFGDSNFKGAQFFQFPKFFTRNGREENCVKAKFYKFYIRQGQQYSRLTHNKQTNKSSIIIRTVCKNEPVAAARGTCSC